MVGPWRGAIRRLIAGILGIWGVGWVPAVLAAPAGPELRDRFPVTSSARIFPVSEVRRGQKGIGYTVFSGAKPEPFGVEILGLMEDFLGPGQPLVLAKLSGPKIEFAGVIAGMSGSPVFIGDRLLGAVGYSFAKFQKEPIAGITPIGGMLQSARVGPGPSAPPRITLDLLKARPRPKPLPIPTRGQGKEGLTPLYAPLMLQGLSEGARGEWARRFRQAGYALGAAGRGRASSARFKPRSPQDRTVEPNRAVQASGVTAPPISPAGPIGVVLMKGDVQVWSLGTVTMVEDDRVYAFGHPFNGSGRVRLPMATAAVLNTLASWSDSFKQGALGIEVGMITDDRLTAVAGKLGQVAGMVPVRVLLRDERGAIERKVEIVDDPLWLPIMLEAAITSAANDRLQFESGGTVDFIARVHVEDRTLEYRDTYSAQPPLAIAAFVARDIGISVGSILQNPIRPATLKGVEVELWATPEYEGTRILQVLPSKRFVRPGETLDLRVQLQPYRGAQQTVTMRATIPSDARGTVELVLGGGVELDRRDAMVYGGRSPKTFDDYLSLVIARRPARGIFGRLIYQSPGVIDGVDLLASLPPAQRAILLSRKDDHTHPATQTLGPAIVAPYEQVVVGSVALELSVVPN